ncbi:MAG: NTP transferase domain-containing protein [Desulfobacterales bacterium]|jgi:putative nucleotidyltransferase with HDIG domain|nr:NTP transferase domain-containing protein [Desulfobacterales bacterium]
MKKDTAIAAIVLAAGLSERMGRFKPLLPLGACRTIERVVTIFQTAGIEEIIVVTGHRGADVRQVMAPLNVRCIENPNYLEGMFSSVLTGIQALPARCRKVFIHPVDIPLVRSHTVRRLVTAFKKSSASILYPTFDGRRGHPTLIHACLAPLILEWPGLGGLRAFLKCHDADSLELPVADEAILLDLDTPQDYHRMLDRLTFEGLPTENECRVLMEVIQCLPPDIKAHCRAVAVVAQRLAEALNAAGIFIDGELVHTAALLHDIARTRKDHAEAGAQLLETHGFNRLSPIVRAHMDLNGPAGQPIDETQVVYLADKLVAGDQRVDLEKRFARKLEKYGLDPFAVSQIARRRENARRIQAEVERLTGLAIDTIVGAAGPLDEKKR